MSWKKFDFSKISVTEARKEMGLYQRLCFDIDNWLYCLFLLNNITVFIVLCLAGGIAYRFRDETIKTVRCFG